jgi:hypothetical protein
VAQYPLDTWTTHGTTHPRRMQGIIQLGADTCPLFIGLISASCRHSIIIDTCLLYPPSHLLLKGIGWNPSLELCPTEHWDIGKSKGEQASGKRLVVRGNERNLSRNHAPLTYRHIKNSQRKQDFKIFLDMVLWYLERYSLLRLVQKIYDWDLSAPRSDD